ncbi:transketolase [Sesbania bispinosa]|nr:transketolase [Sesbania bispinosa]
MENILGKAAQNETEMGVMTQNEYAMDAKTQDEKVLGIEPMMMKWVQGPKMRM